MSDKTNKEKTEKLFELIEDIQIAMLTTVEDGHSLRSRPMWVRRREGDGQFLYCFTRDDSGKVRELCRDRHVNLAFADKGDQEYVSVSGKASVTEDRTLIDDLWSEGARAWFPDGKDDPNLAVIKISIEYAEYWDAPNGLMVTAFGWAKARLTGEPPRSVGDNEKLGAA